jgi:hypothetical protein
MNAVVSGAIALVAIFGGIKALRVVFALRISRGDRDSARSEHPLRPRLSVSALLASGCPPRYRRERTRLWWNTNKRA